MIECEFIGSNRLVEKFDGKIRVDDLIFLKEEEFTHKNYHIGINFLMDLREAEIMGSEISWLQKINDFLSVKGSHLKNSNIAVLANIFQYDIFNRWLREVKITENKLRIKIFLKDTEADQWLNEFE